MIKNTIIVILLILLLITFYAYVCLSTNMVDFQKERMQHIVTKEDELKHREENLVSLTECNNNMNKYKKIIHKISDDLTKTTDDFNNVVKYINQVNNTIKNDINQVNDTIKNDINQINDIIKNDINQLNIEMSNETPKNETSKTEEHFEKFENFENHEDALDKPIDDVFITALD